LADLITGLYHNRSSAEDAVDKLENLGYKREDISVIMHDRTRTREFAETTGTTAGSEHKTADATKTAAKVGGALAAILAGAAAVGAMRQEKADDRSTTVGSVGGTPTASSADRTASNTYDASLGSQSTGYSALGNVSGGESGSTGTTTDDSPERSGNVKPFVAGPLAAVLLPALGAGLLTAFLKAGIPKEHAERYAQGLESGGIVVGVQARSGDESRVRAVLNS